MFQYFSTILYVHFGNSREGKSTSGVGNPFAPHRLIPGNWYMRSGHLPGTLRFMQTLAHSHTHRLTDKPTHTQLKPYAVRMWKEYYFYFPSTHSLSSQVYMCQLVLRLGFTCYRNALTLHLCMRARPKPSLYGTRSQLLL